MALLKKIRGASLMETLIASVIIVAVFMIASFSINNIFLNSLRSEDNLLQNRLQELQYLSEYGKLSLPFYEEGPYWIIFTADSGETGEWHIRNMRNGKEYKIELLKFEEQ